MEHLVQFGISVDDDAIKKTVMQSAEKQIIQNITNDIRKTIFPEKWTGCRYELDTYSTYREFVKEIVENLVMESRQEIVDGVISGLTEKVFRSKMLKDRISELGKE